MELKAEDNKNEGKFLNQIGNKLSDETDDSSIKSGSLNKVKLINKIIGIRRTQ